MSQVLPGNNKTFDDVNKKTFDDVNNKTFDDVFMTSSCILGSVQVEKSRKLELLCFSSDFVKIWYLWTWVCGADFMLLDAWTDRCQGTPDMATSRFLGQSGSLKT